jgi:N-acetylglucosamine-6-phosphate deacetylase
MGEQQTLISNARLVVPGLRVHRGDVLIGAGKVKAVGSQIANVGVGCERIDAGGLSLTPGLVDLHVHGIGNSLFEVGPEDLLRGSDALPEFGTTCVLPTLYTVMKRATLPQLAKLADSLNQVTGAAMPGFHLEGPFLAVTGSGASTVDGDVAMLDELVAATDRHILAMSVSPETKNIIPVIERLREHEVTVFLTHTTATVEQTQRAIDAGATHATHFYDVFPVPQETEPGVRPSGVVETVLADSRCTVDFICDGIHVHPMAIRAALAAKGWQGVIAVTDGNIGAGMDDGEYPTPWGFHVRVRRGEGTRVADRNHTHYGLLAGSSLTLNEAVSNLHRWLDLDSQEIWAMATCNPARCVGLRSKGQLEVGADADLVLWDCVNGNYQAVRTWIAGEIVYAAEPMRTHA